MAAYTLHYAPDNASMIIRLVLEELGVPFHTKLVDRSTSAQRSAAYKKLNPVGRIPALETQQGAHFETAAIALWLADTHRERASLFPATDDARRGPMLSWLFFLSNTLHSDLRNLFYPASCVGPDPTVQAALHKQVTKSLQGHFDLIEEAYVSGALTKGETPTICDLYIVCLLRWCALYPRDGDRSWFDLTRWTSLHALAIDLDARGSTQKLIIAEGLGPTPFSNPQVPNPPEGSAL